jgi:hypothetical protein
MKKLMTTLCFTCALAIVAQAEEGTSTKKKHHGKPPTADQMALQKEMLEKYDTNKDGKLEKKERAKISSEDKAKMEKAGIWGKKPTVEKPEPATK